MLKTRGGWKMFQVVLGGFRWFQVVSDCFKWFQMVSGLLKSSRFRVAKSIGVLSFCIAEIRRRIVL
jgi:hypothetical protein